MDLSSQALGRATVKPPRESVAAPPLPRTSVTAALNLVFNFMALTAVVLLGCLPLVTAPMALQAGMVALDRWCGDGEDRVVKQFLTVLRSRAFARTTLAVGVPMVAAVVAVAEIEFFAARGAVGGALCLGLGVAGLMLALAGLGYVLLLGVRRPDLSASDLWYLSVALTARNLLGASPLLVAELLGSAVLLVRDPALTVIGLPLALLALVRVTADRGVCRVLEQGLEAVEFLDDREVAK
jgi:hypothetical protein